MLLYSSTKQEMSYDIAVSIRFLDLFRTLAKQPHTERSLLPDVIFNNYENWLNQV